MIGRGEELEKQVGIPVKDRSIFIPVTIIVNVSTRKISSLIMNCINQLSKQSKPFWRWKEIFIGGKKLR